MKIFKLSRYFVFATLLLISCTNNVKQQKRDQSEHELNMPAYIEKESKENQDSIFNIKVNIYVRTDVVYDSDGWSVDMGRLVLIKDFQEKKEYQLKGYDFIEKIEIIGREDNISLVFISKSTNKLVHEENGISLQGTKTYTTSDPQAKKNEHYQEWLNTKRDGLIIKVLYKDNNIFEGVIFPANQ